MPNNKQQYDSNYVKANVRQFMVKVSRIYEPELITWLESKENVAQYIRDLVRKDMEQHQNQNDRT